MWTIIFKKSLLNLLQYFFCFLFCFVLTMRQVGSQLPDKGSHCIGGQS